MPRLTCDTSCPEWREGVITEICCTCAHFLTRLGAERKAAAAYAEEMGCTQAKTPEEVNRR